MGNPRLGAGTDIFSLIITNSGWEALEPGSWTCDVSTHRELTEDEKAQLLAWATSRQPIPGHRTIMVANLRQNEYTFFTRPER